jgi:6-phosphogluconolactonase
VSPPELRVVDDLPGAAIEQFLETNPRTLALTGGSTPEPVYERLAQISYPWEEVQVFMGDERCVPPDHPDSNYGMAKRALLDHVHARVHPPPFPCDADTYERELHDVFGEGIPRFDLIHLGMGPDGHTASLFPGKPALEVEDRLVTYVPEPGMPPPHPRLTVTFPVLRAAKVVTFLVSGEDKRERVRQLLTGGDIPAAKVTAERVIVLADPSAAEGLDGPTVNA